MSDGFWWFARAPATFFLVLAGANTQVWLGDLHFGYPACVFVGFHLTRYPMQGSVMYSVTAAFYF